MNRIGFIGCGKEKRDETAAVADLYTSGFFGLKRDWANEHLDTWWVLSAEHGLIHHAVRIRPYDTTAKDSDFDAEAWATSVQGDLEGILRMIEPTEIVLMAGSDYLDPLEPFLADLDLELERPLDGMGWGSVNSRRGCLIEPDPRTRF